MAEPSVRIWLREAPLAPHGVRCDGWADRLEHSGPCVEVDGLDVGWTWPTTPLGEGTLN